MNRVINLHTEKFTVRSSDVAPNGKARFDALCDMLQEAAGNHALKLNFDISQLQQQELTWILHKLHVKMDRFPDWRDQVEIETWPSGGDRLRAWRDFRIKDSKGRVLGASVSYWIILDMNSKRPVRIPETILQMVPKNEKHLLPLRRDKLAVPDPMTQAGQFSVRKSDLDLNNHVNNVAFVGWLLETGDWIYQPGECLIEFHHEALFGDEIAGFEHAGADGNRIRALKRKSDNQLLASALLL